MTPEPASDQADGTQTLRAALRHGLTTALKRRDTEALAALRIAIAAIENAEAVPAPHTRPPAASARIAGASSGAGSSEATRRQLSASQLCDILRDQVTEHNREADRYDALGQADAARRLRRQARTLAAYIQ